METTQLAGIGIRASRIALGTWAIGCRIPFGPESMAPVTQEEG